MIGMSGMRGECLDWKIPIDLDFGKDEGDVRHSD